MKKCISIIVALVILTVGLYSADFSTVDNFIKEGNFTKALTESKAIFNTEKNATVLWRIGRSYFEIAEKKTDKKEIIGICEEGMSLLKPYVEGTIEGEPIDIARVIYWYDVLFSKKGKAVGIKESLDIMPEMFRLADKAISVYKEIGEPYHLKGMIDEAVPSLFGGNKLRMGVNLNNAMKYDPENIVFLVDAAGAFWGRSWDSNKRGSEALKAGLKTDGTPDKVTDKDYAKQILNKAFAIADKKGSNMSFSEKEKIEYAKKLAQKIK